MLRQGLILTSHHAYAQSMRQGLLSLGNAKTRVDIELDALRAMQLIPQQYDLILLDSVLDSMDGLQLLLLMKQQAPACRFIIVSDASDENLRGQAYQNGADYFVVRPKSDADLKNVLENIAGLLKSQGDEGEAKKEAPLVKISDIVQTRCLSGDTALLLVTGRHQSGDIFIYRGDVYHAQYPGRSGIGAFHDIMHWDDGLLQVKSLKLNHVPPRTIDLPYTRLLEKAGQGGGLLDDLRPTTGKLISVDNESATRSGLREVLLEAPPLQVTQKAPTPSLEPSLPPEPLTEGETPLPPLNSHWKVNLTGELVEGSQVAEVDRCAFITYFFYRKLADIAITLDVEYFNNMTLYGPHLQQVLVADNLGVRHAVFDTAWTNEANRDQYVQWCCEQSF